MRSIIALAIVMMFLPIRTFAFDNTSQSPNMMPPGMKMNAETKQAKILKVYSAKDKGAKFRAYVVRWKDTEVVVSDWLGTTNYKKGDTITFLANRLEMQYDNTIKILQFMIMNPGTFMKDK